LGVPVSLVPQSSGPLAQGLAWSCS
jgi:hypothetical protein